VTPAALFFLCLAAFDGELATWLERAGSSDWAERARAQRWLATHLEAGDAAQVAARVAGPDAEVRARLARAIGGQARLVDLAANLALRAEPGAAEVGRESLREQILAFDPGAEAEPSETPDWLGDLRLAAPERLAVAAELRAGPPGALLDLLARELPSAPPLVLDPRARDLGSVVPAGELVGTLPEMLLQCSVEHGLRVLGFGFGPAAEGRPWILLAPAEAANSNAAELLGSWILGAANQALAPAERAADARALAATGWPAALAFLERRWIGGDEPALAGLLLAAGRGRVAPALQDPQRQRALYARLAAAEHDGSALARALGAAGPLSRAGEPLGALALEGFERAAPRERWLRLVVLEGQRRAFPEALAAADLVLAAPASPAPLLVEALRVRAVLAGAAPTPPADPAALLGWASDARRRAELRALWSGLALPWPAQWNGLVVPPEQRALLLQLAWLAHAREPALKYARELIEDRSTRAFDELCAALAELGDRALADSLPSSVALLAGFAPSAADEARIARWLAAGPQSAEELLALASQAASGRGAEVRAKLVELLDSGFTIEERIAALDRAALELQQRGADSELESFANAARGRARSLSQAELRTRLRPGRWPAPLRGVARDLGRDERELERW
jgi:hypothetical protein